MSAYTQSCSSTGAPEQQRPDNWPQQTIAGVRVGVEFTTREKNECLNCQPYAWAGQPDSISSGCPFLFISLSRST